MSLPQRASTVRALGRTAIAASALSLAFLAGCGDTSSTSDSSNDSASAPAGGNAQRTPPAEAAPVAAVRPANAPDAHPLFGEPLIIDGEVIPFERIRRHLATGEYGTPLIETMKHQVYIDQELARRKEAGEDVSQFEVAETEIDEAISELEQTMKDEFPEDDINIDQAFPTIKPSKNEQGFRERLRITKLFDNVFLPDNPYEYPPVTIEALEEAAPGAGMYDSQKKSWDDQLAQGGPKPQGQGGGDFFKMMLRSLVLKHMESFTTIEYPGSGLPDDVLLRVNGTDIKVDRVWNEVQHLITPEDVEKSKKWILKTTLAERALREAGHWIEGEELDAIYKEEHDPYKDSPFSLERVALLYRKFPSLSDYRLYYQIYQSYKRMIKDELTDEVLQARIDRLDLLLSGEVDVDIILISAYDFQKSEWKENGWVDAQERVEAVAKELFDGKSWDEAVEEYSEFWDAPVALSQADAPEGRKAPQHDKGRYRNIKRNDLMRRLLESDYTVFLESSSLSDHIFYMMEPGAFEKPLKGPHGYYIPLVKTRRLTQRKANLADETHRELMIQDYVTNSLNEFLWKEAAAASVYGIDS